MSAAPREAMEYDVVIVGAGPAGLAAAIRLKQLAAETGKDVTVCVLEKGSEVGAHILSGAVIDPIGAQRTHPRLEGKGRAARHAGDRRPLPTIWARQASIRMPNFLHAAADEQSRQLHRQPRQRLPLARQAGRSARRRDLSGLRRRRSALRRQGRGEGRRDRRHGHRPRRQTQARASRRGMELHGKYTLHRRRRARLAREGADRSASNCDEGREPQKFGIGIKELWEVPPEKHKPGLVMHTMGWPLDDETGGGSFMYHFGRQSRVDRLRRPSRTTRIRTSRRSTNSSASRRIRRSARILEGGKRIAYGARAITEGGFQSVPKLTFPGGALIGCSAGFVNVPRIKGSHNAMKTGMLAAEAAFAALARRPRARRARPPTPRPTNTVTSTRT